MNDGGSIDPDNEQYAYPQYKLNVLDSLAKNEGVACFMARREGQRPTVVYCSHKMDGPTWLVANSTSEHLRALLVTKIQRGGARDFARKHGFEAEIA